MRIDELETGDYLTFYNPASWLSWAIGVGDGGPVSHVALAIRSPPWIPGSAGRVYVLESGWEPYVDAEDGVQKFGPQMAPAEQMVGNYRSKDIYVHKLTSSPRAWTPEQLAKAHLDVHNLPYATSPTLWLRELLRWPGAPSRRAFHCSGMLAYVYRALGLLPADFDYSYATPEQFATGDLPFVAGVRFAPPERLA